MVCAVNVPLTVKLSAEEAVREKDDVSTLSALEEVVENEELTAFST